MQTTCSSTHGRWVVLALVSLSVTAEAQPGSDPSSTPDNPYTLTDPENPYGATEDNPYAGGTTGSDPGTAATDEASAPVGEDESDDDIDRKVRLHAFGFGMGNTSIATESTFGLSFLGPAVSHTYFIGRRWGFASRLGMSFPLSGRMADQDVDFRAGLANAYDDRRFESDALLMAAYRAIVANDVQVIAGFGVHVHTIRLLGNEYQTIDGITGGFGGLARLDYFLGDVLSLGGELAVGLDPLDFVDHDNRMVVTFPVQFTISLGVRR